MKRKRIARPVLASNLLSSTLDDQFADAVAVVNGMDAVPMFGVIIEDVEQGDADEEPTES